MKRSTVLENMKRISNKAQGFKHNLKHNPTTAEMRFLEILKSRQIPYCFQKIMFTPNMFFILDFVVYMKPKTIFEIDGSAHLGKEDYDRRRTDQILQHKKYKHFRVVRIKNEQVFNGEAFEIVKGMYPRKFRDKS